MKQCKYFGGTTYTNRLGEKWGMGNIFNNQEAHICNYNDKFAWCEGNKKNCDFKILSHKKRKG